MFLSSLVWCLPRSTRPSSPGYAPWHLDASGIIHFRRWTWLDGTSIMSIKRVAKLMQFGHQDPGWNVPLCKSIIASSVLRRKNLTQDQVSIHILQFGFKQSRGAEHCEAYKSLLNANHIEPLGHTGSLAALRINFLSQSSSLPIDLLEACASKEGTWCQYVPSTSQRTTALIGFSCIMYILP